MALGIAIAVALGNLIGSPKVLWISIVVLSLTQATGAQMKAKAKTRFLSTLIGFALYIFVIDAFIPKEMFGLAGLLLGFVYSFLTQYKHQQIIITINVIIVAVASLGVNMSIGLRFIMLIIGVGIVTILYAIQLIVDKSRESKLVKQTNN